MEIEQQLQGQFDSPPPRPNGQTRANLWSALQIANIPTLVMVVAQLSGEPKWLREPYAPVRTRGMDDNDSGGLPEAIQDEIRRAAYDLVLSGASGDSVNVPSPTELAEMASTCMGETIPVEYGEMMLEEMGLISRHPEWESVPDRQRLADFSVLVIGAGISGICAAIELRRANIACTVVEKSSSIGGTWYENTYPGSGVDTPSHLYSYSFAPKNWTRYFAKQEEIKEYLEDCVDRFGVRESIRLDTEALSATFDAETNRWAIELRTADGSTTTESHNVLISAVGQLNVPSQPTIDGADDFAGPIFHSARWPDDLDLTGKQLAVIGTGATAMQIVPTVADVADRVTVFQRSPQWAAPSTNYKRSVPDGVRYLMENVPLYASWYRCRLVWSYSDKVHESLQVDPDWDGGGASINAVNDGHRQYFTRYLKSQLGDRADLLPKVVPTYPPFAKRMLVDNDWFQTVTHRNVEIVDAGISHITENGIVDVEGESYPSDVIVYATGFATLRMLGSYEVRGRDGRSLRSEWGDDDARAYLGIAIRGFPNFFCLYGPNTGLGHGGSLIFLTECATRYAVNLIERMIADNIDMLEVKQSVYDEYNKKVDEAHQHMIWTHPGTNNWYRNSRGRVITNSPWRVVDYWRMTHDPNLDEFDVESNQAPATLGAKAKQ